MSKTLDRYIALCQADQAKLQANQVVTMPVDAPKMWLTQTGQAIGVIDGMCQGDGQPIAKLSLVVNNDQNQDTQPDQTIDSTSTDSDMSQSQSQNEADTQVQSNVQSIKSKTELSLFGFKWVKVTYWG